MSFFSILESLFLGPLKLLFEFIFQYAYNFLENPAWAIVVLSLMMNILVLPLYKRADAMQEEARDIDNKLSKGVTHIKKVFSGDEKMMILQTYYRQNNYKPTDVLKGSVSLLLEIPFFMAAYQFLSNLDVLNGASLGPIKDLGSPDGLLVIGGLAINVLPVLMTLINVISSAIYLKGFPLKTKIQLYAMALFFLVFLYTSPSGLVFYWTLNNLFSLVKTIFYKLKNPKKVLRILLSAVGILGVIFGGFVYNTDSLKRKALIITAGVLLQLPLIIHLIKSKLKTKENHKPVVPNKKLFLAGSVFLTVLVGLLIPSTFIASSPQEFVDITYFYNPLWYLVSTFCLAAGTFLIWLRVFYWLAVPKGKVVFDRLVWIMSGVMLVNYMFFGTKLGVLTSNLQYEKGLDFSWKEQLINIAVILAVTVVFCFVVSKWSKVVTGVLLTAIIALGAMSVVNIVTIKTSVDDISLDESSSVVHFELSEEGQNVVVLMLDRAMGEYVPYIFNEKPELKDKFDGFTYYSNTISYGGHTNFGAPPLLGGYEYTPVEMNIRDEEALVSKHNEALKVMPVIFNKNGYDVTVCDPPYANYKGIPDLSIYDDYPEINTYITKGKFNDVAKSAQAVEYNHRNFFCFSVMKTLPLSLQPTIYDGGSYRKTLSTADVSYTTQTTSGLSVANGYKKTFMDSYNVLTNLNTITDISEENKNTFMFMSNDTTHEVAILQEPEYIPAYEVDNTQYDKEHTDRFTYNGSTITVNTVAQMKHYQSNMAAFIQIGNWLDYLRDNDVYDNTKIILVADHGYSLFQSEALDFSNKTDDHKAVDFYYPLLMVKDFNAEGFTTSAEFMTNADVPTLATKDLIENPVNPFTGKAINSSEKTAHKQMVIVSNDHKINKNNGNTFLPARWASISDDIWNRDNWEFYEEETVLKEHKLPTN